MPMQAYVCAEGHHFESLVAMDRSDAPKACIVPLDFRRGPKGTVEYDRCGATITPVIAAPASVFPGADSWRK